MMTSVGTESGGCPSFLIRFAAGPVSLSLSRVSICLFLLSVFVFMANKRVHYEGAHPLCSTLSQQGLSEIKLGSTNNLTASAF